MQLIPVLDLMGGGVVRGVAGERSQYRPVVSQLCPVADPVCLARAFRERLGLGRLYLADLDAITGQPPALGCYRRLLEEGCELCVDAGLRSAQQAELLAEAGVATIVAGLETVATPGELAAMLQQLGPARVLFSLDLKGGRPLLPSSDWPAEPQAVLELAAGHGVRRILILDLARVGMGQGLGTEPLARWTLARWPDLEVWVGGGVAGPEDLRQLRELGVHGVLVASALHDGRITHQHIVELGRES